MKFKLLLAVLIYTSYCLSAQAFDIRNVKDIKIVSKASYELNDTNLVDKNSAKNLLKIIFKTDSALLEESKKKNIKHEKDQTLKAVLIFMINI